MSDFILQSQPTVSKSRNHTLWVEKYRPLNLDEYIGNESIKTTFKQCIDNQDIGNILLFGGAGQGKTTLAKLLAKSISCDHLYINASDEGGIDTVRNKIKNFASSAGFKKLKIITLDEFGNSGTLEAQGALRNIMETYALHTRFILTTNYKEKIIEPIQSRCQVFEIKPLSKKEVAMRLVKILKAENVEFTQEDIVFIITTYYPDIRKVINVAQQSTINGKLIINKENAIEADFLNKLVDLLKNEYSSPSTFNTIRQIVADSDNSSLELIYKHLFDKVDEFAPGKQAMIILELAESMYQSTLIIPKARDITFIACIGKILKHLNVEN